MCFRVEKAFHMLKEEHQHHEEQPRPSHRRCLRSIMVWSVRIILIKFRHCTGGLHSVIIRMIIIAVIIAIPFRRFFHCDGDTAYAHMVTDMVTDMVTECASTENFEQQPTTTPTLLGK